jgi:tRNA(Ile)-lysidine synthase
MPDFPAAVAETIRRERLLPRGSRVLVGLSGGPDSMALVAALRELADELDIRLEAAHLDHDLRDGSGAAADFAERHAHAWGVPFHRRRIDWRARGGRPASNVEAIVREIRYEFLREVAGRDGVVAVAHHAGDRLESFLVNLLRGAGPRGLSLPRYRRDDGVVRPLLDRSRDEIVEWLRDRGIPWLEDPANHDGSNLRGRLRAEVIPLLERENPDFARTVARTAAVLGELDALVCDLAREARRELEIRTRPGEIELDGPRGRAYHSIVLSTCLREAIRATGSSLGGIGFEPLQQCAKAWKKAEKRIVDLPGGVRIEIGTRRVRVLRAGGPAPAVREQEIPVPGRASWSGDVELAVRIELPPADPARASGPGVVWMDADRVVRPLRVRGRRPGDRYRPLGLQGTVKVQDLFVDRKIPREWRDSIPVLEDAEGILWVPGFRVEHRTRITENTRAALRVEMTGGFPLPESMEG